MKNASPPSSSNTRCIIEPLEPRQFLSAVSITGGTTPIDPANFVSRITNPYLPLIPGTIFIYKGVEDGKPSRDVMKVTRKTDQILGVTVTVVLDSAFSAGKLVEKTLDWFAQDKQGNVWYFGEDTKSIRNGQVISTEGSWRAGVNGAMAGIVMEAHPKVGDIYNQEFAPDVAEDRGKVLSLRATAQTPFANFDRVLQTKDFSPLEPDVVEHKFYARGIGFVRSNTVKGGDELVKLVAIRYS